MNLHRERGRPAAALRALPLEIPELASLRFSHDISGLSTLPRGLVLIGGPTGSGKTTTLASLVALINGRDARHIITVEDPIEYEHAHRRSIVEQVEVGIDTLDFPTALRAAMRQAPDIIIVGEMRDPETMRVALAAAETGHLVCATVHTTDVATAVSRIADAFPTERQNAVRQELAMSLAAVLTQTLVTGRDGSRSRRGAGLAAIAVPRRVRECEPGRPVAPRPAAEAGLGGRSQWLRGGAVLDRTTSVWGRVTDAGGVALPRRISSSSRTVSSLSCRIGCATVVSGGSTCRA